MVLLTLVSPLCPACCLLLVAEVSLQGSAMPGSRFESARALQDSEQKPKHHSADAFIGCRFVRDLSSMCKLQNTVLCMRFQGNGQ
jgi:hypothetical protein